MRNDSPPVILDKLHFQCSIDLKGNVLRIGTTGTETSFLAESELPECARLSSISEESAIAQSRRQAEDKDLQEALNKSRESSSKSDTVNY